jgi:hypothetical protein
MISIVNERLANPGDGVAAGLDVVEKAGYRAERMKSERWRSVS